MRRLDGGGALQRGASMPYRRRARIGGDSARRRRAASGDTKSLSLRRASSTSGYDKNLGKSSRMSVASSLRHVGRARAKLSSMHEHSQPFFSESGVTFRRSG